MNRYIPYGKHCIEQDDIDTVVRILQSDYITQGPLINELEKKLADYCGSSFCVVLNSGTSALHCIFYALGLTSGDEFITSPLTFAATANAGLYLGAHPNFVDIEESTGNIDPLNIEQSITSRTKLIVPVHYAGHPADMESIWNIAKANNLCVVEDACHALGAVYKGEKVGSCRFSDAVVLSFHPVKHITTGEGGAILTNNEKLYKKMIMFRTHGITRDHFYRESDGPWYYEMQLLGYNYRLTDIQAGLGVSQLTKLDRFIKRRREIAQKYKQAFEKNEYFSIPIEKEYVQSAYHLYPIRLKKVQGRGEIFDSLRKMGIGAQVHYIPVYWHPYYVKLGYARGLCPISENFYQQVISLPMYPAMNDDDVQFVIETIKRVIG